MSLNVVQDSRCRHCASNYLTTVSLVGFSPGLPTRFRPSRDPSMCVFPFLCREHWFAGSLELESVQRERAAVAATLLDSAGPELGSLGFGFWSLVTSGCIFVRVSRMVLSSTIFPDSSGDGLWPIPLRQQKDLVLGSASRRVACSHSSN